MELEIRHLRALVTVADHGSVTKAAVALGVSQPSLSAQVLRIERLFGAPLFERSRSGVVPTAQGRTVLAKARIVLADMAELRALGVHRGDPSRPVELQLGGMPGPFLPAAVRQLVRLHEAGTLTVHAHTEASSKALLRMVQTGRLDAAFVSDIAGFEAAVPHGVRHTVLVSVEPLFVGLSEDHPLAGQEVIELGDLAGEQWLVDPNDDLGGIAYLMKACRAAGFQPKINNEVGDGATARAFISGGQYVALFQAIAPEGLGVVLRPLAGDPIVQRHGLAWTERCPVDHDIIRRAALDAYLGFVDNNPSFYRWWSEHCDRTWLEDGTYAGRPRSPLR